MTALHIFFFFFFFGGGIMMWWLQYKQSTDHPTFQVTKLDSKAQIHTGLFIIHGLDLVYGLK